ncbi:hypothetical protein [Wolinella succinogenes]|uniref:hypothetical protein n=1 Tax=Wolinella succinogenes TaxID=844 RepID=UPI00240A4A59|nr:hypothetical protein [Wolinella succinogenes]
MLIFGHPAIPAPRFRPIQGIDQIAAIPASEVVFFDASMDASRALGCHCHQEKVAYAVKIGRISELLLYANLGASYVILEDFLQSFQQIADHYLLDTKILVTIEKESQIEEVAKLGIDGVIFSHFLA